MTDASRRERLYDELCAELTQSGTVYCDSDVWGFVAACWPTAASARELAQDWLAQATEETA